MATTHADATVPSVELSERFVREAMPYVAELSRKARVLTRHSADAEDLMQETLLRAYAGFETFKGGNFRAWLYRIQANAWINIYRARMCRPSECLTDMITDAQMAQECHRGSGATCPAEVAVLRDIPDDEVTAALRQLDHCQQVVVYLADVEGLQYKEIARLTGMPLGTVMSRIHRGRKALRGLLDGFGHDRGYLRDIPDRRLQAVAG